MKKLAQSFYILSLLYIYGCNGQAAYPIAQPEQSKSSEELRLQLKTQEKSAPTKYLFAAAKMQENKILIQKPDFFHHSKYVTDGYTVSGTINNTASVARFKDVILRVTFYSETQSAIETKDITLYKYFAPNSTVLFETKVYPPEAMKNFGAEVIAAKPAN